MASARPSVVEAGVDSAAVTSGVAITIQAGAGATVIAKVNEGESPSHLQGSRAAASTTAVPGEPLRQIIVVTRTDSCR
jgi:hypothetical protein